MNIYIKNGTIIEAQSDYGDPIDIDVADIDDSSDISLEILNERSEERASITLKNQFLTDLFQAVAYTAEQADLWNRHPFIVVQQDHNGDFVAEICFDREENNDDDLE